MTACSAVIHQRRVRATLQEDEDVFLCEGVVYDRAVDENLQRVRLGVAAGLDADNQLLTAQTGIIVG